MALTKAPNFLLNKIFWWSSYKLLMEIWYTIQIHVQYIRGSWIFYHLAITINVISLSHRPTLITILIVFLGIENLFHKKCHPDETRTHNLLNQLFIDCYPPRWPLAPRRSEPQIEKLAGIKSYVIELLALWKHKPNTCSLLQGCGFKSSCSKFFYFSV